MYVSFSTNGTLVSVSNSLPYDAKYAGDNVYYDSNQRLYVYQDGVADSIMKDSSGKIVYAGNIRLFYNQQGLIAIIGNDRLFYDNNNKVSIIRNTRIYYEYGKLYLVGDIHV